MRKTMLMRCSLLGAGARRVKCTAAAAAAAMRKSRVPEVGPLGSAATRLRSGLFGASLAGNAGKLAPLSQPSQLFYIPGIFSRVSCAVCTEENGRKVGPAELGGTVARGTTVN